MGSDTDPRLTGVPRSGAIRGWEDEAPDPQVIDSPPAAPPSPHPGAAARSAAEAPSRHLRPPPRRPDRFRHREPRRWGPQKTFLVVVIGLFAMFSGLAIAAATWTTKHVEGTVERVPHVFPTGDRPAQAVAGLTFLLVGRDRASQSDTDSLADSIMLIHVDGSRKDAQVLYLPVSAQLEPGGPTLDEVFGEGGPAQLIGDVEGFTGIRIDHYAELDFAGFRTVTDAVGGVEIDVREPYSNDRYDFPTGRQHLDGAAALAYVRDAERASEAGAAERQQAMIAALFERVSDQGLLSDVGRLTGTLDSMADALRVDDTLSDVDFVQLVWSLRGVSEPDFLTAPLDGTTVQNGRAVVTFDPARAPLLWSYVRDDVLDEHLGEFR